MFRPHTDTPVSPRPRRRSASPPAPPNTVKLTMHGGLSHHIRPLLPLSLPSLDCAYHTRADADKQAEAGPFCDKCTPEPRDLMWEKVTHLRQSRAAMFPPSLTNFVRSLPPLQARRTVQKTVQETVQETVQGSLLHREEGKGGKEVGKGRAGFVRPSQRPKRELRAHHWRLYWNGR